ncbi:phosphoenolpyruvate--protein phosphotransferase [Bellilinea caldifistulae]|uniref:Phosphoenolpyruvate-protein phosphotransferase n=1 Tax=Bellilinea caldifistulae TaxID=360411 RepID=A0A0P6XBB8_9CHLR|nr:phosphoenolpyruvate--protein phosphotransferase [Bellilinea caldifistulae]KPL77563.1 hypothetical protein AC812_03230 [Bellilinea caldifistulae]GAP09650.1 phosphoenolpyruvate--protein phosphotransferase [Bellilinea caldifistulae]
MESLPVISVSRGISIAPIFQFRNTPLVYERRLIENPLVEWERYRQAVQESLNRLEQIYHQAVAEVGTDEAGIFHAHISILQDPDLNDSVKDRIYGEKINAESALYEVSEEYCRMLEEINDEYIRARTTDLRDVRDGVLRILLHVDGHHIKLTSPAIVVARELTPSECLLLDRRLVRGFCTIEGGTTSHTAILSRSLGIPAVVGIPERLLSVPDGMLAILDGYEGKIILKPDQETIQHYQGMQSRRQQIFETALRETHRPALTLDGHVVEVFANIANDNPQDLKEAVQNGAEGVGLLRTEFIYLDCETLPDEEVQFYKYKSVLEAFGNRPVILRTLDIGGDKQLPYLDLPYELNPFLGVRGLRLCLRNLALFKAQIRAALRAASYGNLYLMFPMVTKGAEIQAAKAVIAECRAELEAEGCSIPPRIPIGIMIEIPAAALMARHLAREVDFFSIGTNDLTQYTLAVDRTNSALTDLASGFDPAVLNLIQAVINGAHTQGKKTGICGELGGDPLAIPLLVGMGMDELSMNAGEIPAAKQIIRQISLKDARLVSQQALELETPEEVIALVKSAFPFIENYI